MFSFTSATRRLQDWLNFHKPLTMPEPFEWSAIVNPYLSQATDHALNLYVTAASKFNSPLLDFLDRIEVVWIWLNKTPTSPEHEYIIVETVDKVDGQIRHFIFDRSVHEEPPATTTKNHTRTDINTTPLRSNSLSSMEEGMLSGTTSTTSTHRPPPPLSFPTPQLSIGDALSMSATKASQVLADSLDKGDKLDAFDRILGGHHLLQRRYGCGQNARQIKPNNLKLFELIVLAEVIHNFDPLYTFFDRNCYWYCNMLADAVIQIFGLDTSINPEDVARQEKYLPINPYQTEISGRWKGWKVSHTKPEDLTTVILDFKTFYRDKLAEVKYFFLINYYYLLYPEQIAKNREDLDKVKLVDNSNMAVALGLWSRTRTDLQKRVNAFNLVCSLTFVRT